MLQEVARTIADISTECKLPLDTEEYVGNFTPYLMDVVYAWARGAAFKDIC